jgi:hypothetical protein
MGQLRPRSENANLPGFMVIAPQLPYTGAQLWSADFLPGCHQGTHVVPGPEPVPNIKRRLADPDLQELELGLAAQFNRRHLAQRDNDPQLAARIRSFETAFGMQAAAPEAFDLTKETDATHQLYGLQRGSTKGFAWQCLVARRLAERGVRFLELIDTGASNNWDAHGNIAEHAPPREKRRPAHRRSPHRSQAARHARRHARRLGHRIWPHALQHRQRRQGREHHAQAFTCWMAGGGVKGGCSYGETDDYANTIVNDGVHSTTCTPPFSTSRPRSTPPHLPPRRPRLNRLTDVTEK